MISFDEAAHLVLELARPAGSERVPIARAAGRVLAEPVRAMIDSPPADAAAMDGYALRSEDLPGPLRLIGESFAGSGFAGTVEPGTCVRIFTGAPVPTGADRVMIQENAARTDDRVSFSEGPGTARHIRGRGSDFRTGQLLVDAGEPITPRALVAAAGADAGEVAVWRQPRLVVLATGDELAPPGEARTRPGQIPESVSYGVAALAEQWGARVLETCRVADDLKALERAAASALEQADLIVVTGGASVGERDFAKTMFEPAGLELLFSKVAMKPGKPVWLGRAAGRLVMGLPGNPTSAMVTARLLLAPLVTGLSGRGGALEWQPVRLAAPLAACGERETFVRARRSPSGAEPLGQQDSGAQAPLVEADLLLRTRPQEPARQPGDIVEALEF
ncbi:molybdopterin molybdenumtransferase MoeA [Tsuneonella deserti]|uniref:Molybdopterin molybdenumtransferase n=1 Tax=Tsuneonella deserti TaxID=2035528 RepID=A0ABQ1SCP7_9SPHN|nr:molybdopterin molybdotransferase MoeA [Tsuneonella deserti]GGE00217.1 molybdopterin molybdenumtransferase MoeA [Tsuneonella deserti]